MSEPVLKLLPENLFSEVILVSKWGFDMGSSGHSQYKQNLPVMIVTLPTVTYL